ncbi:hypothetical protein BH20BAC1_BH20BAC1_14430 [soil metagenome]
MGARYRIENPKFNKIRIYFANCTLNNDMSYLIFILRITILLD